MFLLCQGIEYETCWLAGRTNKYTFGLPPKKEKRPFSSSSLMMSTVEKSSPVSTPPIEKVKFVSETRLENGNQKMSNGKQPKFITEIPNGSSKISNGKPKFTNDTQNSENGNLKVSNNKPKHLHPKRRVTKQRSDTLPDVIEDSVDMNESHTSV